MNTNKIITKLLEMENYMMVGDTIKIKNRVEVDDMTYTPIDGGTHLKQKTQTIQRGGNCFAFWFSKLNCLTPNRSESNKLNSLWISTLHNKLNIIRTQLST